MFTYSYFVNTWGLIEALKQVKGDISGDQKKLQDALAQISLNAPYGKITLDENRQAITDQYYLQLVEGDKGLATKTVGSVPDVDQTFGGTFSDSSPAPGRTYPPCEKRNIPWLGKTEKPKVVGARGSVTEAVSEQAEPILRLRGVGRRFGGLDAVRDVDLDVAHGERRAILGPNGAGKTTLFNVISGDMPATSGSIFFLGQDVAEVSAPGRARLGMGRTYQKSRLFLGLSVEDNLYLAVLGTRKGHLRLHRRAVDRELRERARELAGEVGLAPKLGTLVGSISHGEQRQLEVGMARAVDPKLMLLDEPASGLSRGERVALTDMLLELDREITLVLIEHDMDVALRVAERVTMMHDGEKIVEGTPEEIRSNQLVHDLYLGGQVGDDGEQS